MELGLKQTTEEYEGKEIQLFLFDLDDTLIDTKSAMHEAKQRFQTLNGFSAEDMYQFDSIFHPFSSKEERIRAWNEYLQTHTEHPITSQTCYDTFETLRLDALRVWPESKSVLEMLHNSGLPYAILTNGHPSIQEPKIRHSGILDWDCCKNIPVFYGYEGEGAVPKPNPRIFHMACAHFHAAHEATVMVGDTLDTDIVGARNANLGFAIYLQRSEGAMNCAGADSPSTRVLQACSHAHMLEVVHSLLRDSLTQGPVQTLLPGGDVDVVVEGETVSLVDGSGRQVGIIDRIPASNGQVYLIDSILLPRNISADIVNDFLSTSNAV